MTVVMYGKVLTGEARTEFGAEWAWIKPNPCIRGHWRSTKGNLVMVFPPDETIENWIVLVEDEEVYAFSGDKQEARAFAVAKSYTEQKRH